MCGGTWIRVENQSQILTAAHCIMNSKKQLHSRLLVCFSWIVSNLPWKIGNYPVFSPFECRPSYHFNQLQVMGDDLSISRTSASPRRQIRKIRKIVAHPDYSPMNLKHDIAMIFVCVFFCAIDMYIDCTVCAKFTKFEHNLSSISLSCFTLSADVTIRCNQYIRSGSNSERKHSWLSAVLCWYENEYEYKLLLLLNQSFGFNLIVYGSISYSVFQLKWYFKFNSPIS